MSATQKKIAQKNAKPFLGFRICLNGSKPNYSASGVTLT